MLLSLRVFLQITHRQPGEDRKSITSGGPKTTLFSLPGEIFLLLLQLHQSFLAEGLTDMALPQVSNCSWGHACPVKLPHHSGKAACFLGQATKIMCATPWGYSRATLRVAQGWLGTGVLLKIQPVHCVAPLGPFCNVLPQNQWTRKSSITSPLRCSFWPQPPRWFTWSPVSDNWLWTGLAEPPAHEGVLGWEDGPISTLSSNILPQSHFWQDTRGKH